MLNLKPLHHFVLVGEEQNFGAAALRANLSQPALSNSIKTLEDQLGFPLFKRDERPIKLTAEGKELFERAKVLLFEARDLDRQVSALKAGEAGHIRVGFVPTFAASLGGKIFGACHRENAALTFDVDVQETRKLVQLLESEELELIVCDERELTEESDLRLMPLTPHGGGCFCRPDHPVLTLPNPTPQDIFQYGLTSVHMPQLLRRHLSDIFIPPDSNEPLLRLECDNVAMVHDVAMESDLILITTHSSVERALQNGLLRKIDLFLEQTTTWVIATLPSRTLHPSAPKVISSILKVSEQTDLSTAKSTA